jgi:hypothetical protein
MKELPKTSHGQDRRSSADKRSCPRYPFSPAVEAVDVLANTRISGRLSDLGRNGCYMDTISPFAPEAAVTLTITKDNESFKTQAKVVYSQIGMGMGLLFTTAEPEQLRLLGTWLGELGGGKPAERPPPGAAAIHEAPKIDDDLLRIAFTELVGLLGRKNIVNDSEALTLLQKLSK